MKKTKILALASLILAAGLVGCGGGETSSEAVSVEETSQSEVTSTPSDETSSLEEASSSEIETPSEDEKSESTGGNTGTYSSTPALSLAIPSEYPNGTSLSAGTYTFGDFEWYTKKDNKGIVESENKEVLVNGETKTYTQRLNNKSKDNRFYFTTTAASKVIIVGRSSSRDASETRTVNVTNNGAVVGTTTFVGGTGTANAAYAAYEITLDTYGDLAIEIAGPVDSHSSHILDILVYYAA